MVSRKFNARGFYRAVKARRFAFSASEVAKLLAYVSEERVELLADSMAHYLRLRALARFKDATSD